MKENETILHWKSFSRQCESDFCVPARNISETNNFLFGFPANMSSKYKTVVFELWDVAALGDTYVIVCLKYTGKRQRLINQLISVTRQKKINPDKSVK